MFLSRGVVQISAYIDAWLGSFLGTGAVSALGYAQTLYTLPVSLFGMAVSAAELPAMSSAMGTPAGGRCGDAAAPDAGHSADCVFRDPVGGRLRSARRRDRGHHLSLRRISSTTTCCLSGRVLAGSAVGLLASTSGRLYSSAFYALRDTRTPLRFAVIRVALTLGLGYLCALPLPRLLGIDQRWGAAGLDGFSRASRAGWSSCCCGAACSDASALCLPGASRILRLWLVALLAAACGLRHQAVLPFHRPLARGPLRFDPVCGRSISASRSGWASPAWAR